MQDYIYQLAKIILWGVIWHMNNNDLIVELYHKLLEDTTKKIDNEPNSIDKSTNELIIALYEYIIEHKLI